ncbi:MAG: MFS transporter [Promethearchaeota archaeon]
MKPQSLKTMISFGMAELQFAFFSFALGQYLLLFYETEVSLGIWYLTLGYIIYALWNAINDPLVGFLTDNPRNYWKRWGKRFPLIIIGSIPFVFLIVFIFSPPNWNPDTQPWFYFVWFVLSTCFFDTFYSIVQTSHLAQYPDIFRLDDDRRKAGGIAMALGLIGTALGALIPGFIVVFYVKESYAQMAWVVAIVGFITFLTYIYGHRESEGLKLSYYEREEEKESFISLLKIIFKHKNFMVVMMIFFLDSIIGASLTASISYIVKYDLKMDPIIASVVLAGFLLGALGSMIFWLRYAQQLNNNRKMLIIGVFLNTIFLFPLIFAWNLFSLLLGVILLGIGGGALRIGRNPVIADVIDEAVVKTGTKIEGSLMGIYTFFNRLALIAQGFIFAIVHELTGFNPDVSDQTFLALLGIRIHTALIPMILCLLGLIIFVKVYDLTPERTMDIQALLKAEGMQKDQK